MLLYSDLLNPTQQDMVGWVIIVSILSTLFLNLVYVFYLTCLTIKLKATKQYNLYKHNQLIEMTAHQNPGTEEIKTIEEEKKKEEVKDSDLIKHI